MHKASLTSYFRHEGFIVFLQMFKFNSAARYYCAMLRHHYSCLRNVYVSLSLCRDTKHGSLQDDLADYRAHMLGPDQTRQQEVIVVRHGLLDTTLQSASMESFSFLARPYIVFIGEDGDDHGGTSSRVFQVSTCFSHSASPCRLSNRTCHLKDVQQIQE